MAILNYTTTIDTFKTVAEIEKILVQHKAKSIMKNYEGESIISMSFLVDTGSNQVPVKLPAKVNECLQVLRAEKKSGKKNIKDTKEQAERVSWRILKRLGRSTDGANRYKYGSHGRSIYALHI